VLSVKDGEVRLLHFRCLDDCERNKNAYAVYVRPYLKVQQNYRVLLQARKEIPFKDLPC